MPDDLDRVARHTWVNDAVPAINRDHLNEIEDDLDAVFARAAGGVSFAAVQTLTGPEAGQARRNVGAVGSVAGVDPDSSGDVGAGALLAAVLGDLDFLLGSTPTGGTDDTAMVQAELNAAAAAGQRYVMPPGHTFPITGLDVPVGATLDIASVHLIHPAGVVAGNMLEVVGACRILCNQYTDIDGNKANTTDPGVNTSGNGIHIYSAAGWSGQVEIMGAPKIHDCWRADIYGHTDTTSLHDGALAPDAAVYLDRVEAYNASGICVRFEGMGGIVNFAPHVYGAGSHGIRYFLCNRPKTLVPHSHDNGAAVGATNGHGMVSLYCFEDLVLGGWFHDNAAANADGLVFGGDSTSNVNMPGRYMRVIGVVCNDNGNGGLVFDASLASLNALLADVDYPSGRTTNDPVPVYGVVESVTANGNGNEGVIVNSSEHITFVHAITNDNGGHGIEFASQHCTLLFHVAERNGQKPLALEGGVSGPNWGYHTIGMREYKHNTPDDTITETAVFPSTWLTTQTGFDVPPAPQQVYEARKQVDTPRLNNTITGDPELAATLPVGEYEMGGFLVWDGATGADIQTQWNLTAGATILWGCAGPAGTATSNNPATINTSVFATATGPVLGAMGVGTKSFARITGYLKVTTAGTVTFKWAQNTTDAVNATTLFTGSYITFKKIA